MYEKFVAAVTAATKRMRQGHALRPTSDAGAMCMPNQARYVQELVDDAVAKGARVTAGGVLPSGADGQFYPPTVLVDVKPGMRIVKARARAPGWGGCDRAPRALTVLTRILCRPMWIGLD